MAEYKRALCLILVVALAVCICCFGLYAQAEDSGEGFGTVIFDDSETTGDKIGSVSEGKTIELSRYSDDYWGYGTESSGIRVYDNNSGIIWNDADFLADILIAEGITTDFTFDLPQEVKQYIQNGGKVDVVIKSGNGLEIGKLFVDDGENKPAYTLDSDTITISSYPKFNCKSGHDYYVDGINKTIPRVMPGYGRNTYIIWENGIDIGTAYGTDKDSYEDGDLYYELIDSGSGRLNFDALDNGQRVEVNLYDGSKRSFYKSSTDDIRIKGSSSQIPGAAVMEFRYPVTIDFYTADEDYITAQLKASPSTDPLNDQGVADISVELDSSASRAVLDGEDIEITSRKYWASLNREDLDDDSKGQEIDSPIYEATVQGVTENSLIYCKVRVYSQELDKFAEKIVEVPYIGASAGASGVLKADERYEERFDVLKAIPSSELLYGNIMGKECIIDAGWSRITGTKSYNITVSNGTLSRTYTVQREYSYWKIDVLRVYEPYKAVITNGCLPGGLLELMPQVYTRPEIDHKEYNINIAEPQYRQSINIEGQGIPEAQWESLAQNEVGEIEVWNDRLVYPAKDRQIKIMDDVLSVSRAPDPVKIAIGDIEKFGENVFYKKGLKIENTLPNGTYGSTGKIYYKTFINVGSGEAQLYEKIQINQVNVHTPVVCYAEILDGSSGFNQIKGDIDEVQWDYLILDRPFKIKMPTSGVHRNIEGYSPQGIKLECARYTARRQVSFPFDVYLGSGTSGELVKGGTWKTVTPDANDEVQFYLPAWVDETGKSSHYQINFREIAINGSESSAHQNLANLDPSASMAVDTVRVKIVGRLFGFKISDITDYPDWEDVFRQSANTVRHSGNYYRAGKNDENGSTRPLQGISQNVFDKLTLPIMNGSHTVFRNMGVLKRGYKFRFELETIGSYSGDGDCISITPRFYYVPYDGSKREEVDLWYNERFNDEQNYMVKIDSSKEGNRKNPKYMKLGNAYRNVPAQEIENTSRVEGISKKNLEGNNTLIGWLDRIILPRWVRTYTGVAPGALDSGYADRVLKSRQKWYGEYYLPNELFVAPKGYDVVDYARKNYGVTGKEGFWKKKGYIIVNFDIQTVKGDASYGEALSYKGSRCSMWEIEGFNTNKRDSDGILFPVREGDIVFYYTDKSIGDDYGGGGNY